jgi:WD40 repeat protein
VAICPGGLFLFSVGYDRKLLQTNVESKLIVNTVVLPSDFEGVTNLQITKDGKFAALSSSSGKILTVNLTNQQINIVNDHNRGVINALVLTHDGLYMITASEEDKIRIYDINSLYLLDTINVPHSAGYPVKTMALSPDSEYLVVGTKTGGITIFNFQLREEITSLKTHFNQIEAISITPDSSYFFTTSYDKSLALFDLKRGLKIHNFSVLRDKPIGLAMDSEGQYLSCASGDGKLVIFDMMKKENTKIDLAMRSDSLIFKKKDDLKKSMSVFLNDERHLLAGTQNYLCLYDYVQGFVKYESISFKSITAIAVDFFGRFAAIADDLDIVVLDLESLQNYHIFSFTHQGMKKFSC